MRIMYVCNMIIPIIAHAEKIDANVYGGWLSGMINKFLGDEKYDLCICFPAKRRMRGKVNNLEYYSFLEKEDTLVYFKETEFEIRKIIEVFEPDILHICGTEFPHALAAVNALHNPSRTVISIQGLVSVCAMHYFEGIPEFVQRGNTLCDWIYGNQLRKARNTFKIRGKYEIEALKKVSNVIGRTDWDRACTERINPKIKYYFCNETLRDEFYSGEKWEYEKCEKHSVFISQAGYPIKGMHFIVRIMGELKKSYPDLKVYFAGSEWKRGNWKGRLMESSYNKYIFNKMDYYALWDNFVFCGNLSAEEMKQQYLRCNAFLLASTIENSPNSLCEAMLLGVPVVSSDVGGVKKFITHTDNGYIYPCNEPYMACYYLKKIFENREKMQEMFECAIENMKKVVDRDANFLQIQRVYKEICKRT